MCQFALPTEQKACHKVRILKKFKKKILKKTVIYVDFQEFSDNQESARKFMAVQDPKIACKALYYCQ